ncbi:uncharacterized protein A4U43_C08F26230 [Asparagus officinalis]|nr:uncharacterized protein A4U43_C08F26230 [Asparagus officinalis]
MSSVTSPSCSSLFSTIQSSDFGSRDLIGNISSEFAAISPPPSHRQHLRRSSPPPSQSFREEELTKRASALKVNAGVEPGTDLGPVISKQAKDRICSLIQSGIESGARIVLDGRNIVMGGSSALPYPVLKQREAVTGHRLLERYGMTEEQKHGRKPDPIEMFYIVHKWRDENKSWIDDASEELAPPLYRPVPTPPGEFTAMLNDSDFMQQMMPLNDRNGGVILFYYYHYYYPFVSWMFYYVAPSSFARDSMEVLYLLVI